MSWLKKLAGGDGQALTLVKLRTARFGQVLSGYGRFLELMGEVSEIQEGLRDSDPARLFAANDTLFEIADAVIFDLNVMSRQHHAEYYDPLDRMRSEMRLSLSQVRDLGSDERGTATPKPTPARAEQVRREAACLYAGVGMAACLGVAAGPVYNLSSEGDLAGFPDGGILVAPDLEPEAELIRTLRKAGAILTDFGSPVCHMATMVRDFGLPYIVGLQDVTSRLPTGRPVTVDAGTNAVYEGVLQPLIDIGRDQGPQEQALRRLANELRRTLLPLTIGGLTERPPDLSQCETLHDLIHLAHLNAGNALVSELSQRRDLNRAGTIIELPVLGKARVIDLGDGLKPDLGRDRAYFNDVTSAPLSAVVDGLNVLPNGAGTPAPTFSIAAVTDARLTLIISRPAGFDLIDALMSDDKEQSRLYCRFCGRASEQDTGPWRGAYAREVLHRLGFLDARTSQAAEGVMTALSRAEMEERLKTAGRLLGRIAERDREGWEEAVVEERVDIFLNRFG